MVEINISSGQGVTQAIATKLGLSKADCKKINLSTWQNVMTEVNNAKAKNAKEQSIFKSGGNFTTDTNKLGDKSSHRTNFVVDKGTMVINDSAWNKIVAMLTGKAPEAEQPTPTTVDNTPVAEEPVQNESVPEETPAPEQEVITEETIVDKTLSRSVNGEKQDIGIRKENGKTVRYQINEDGSLGDTLAATKTFGKNKYISGNFPPETKILEREVNGEKVQIGVFEDENGNKIRKLVTKDPQTGKPTLGENLVTVSTMGKNKYVTQSKFEADVRNMLRLKSDEPLPTDIKAEYVTIAGQESMVLKKDGRIMDSAQIKEYLTAKNNPPTKEAADIPTSITSGANGDQVTLNNDKFIIKANGGGELSVDKNTIMEFITNSTLANLVFRSDNSIRDLGNGKFFAAGHVANEASDARDLAQNHAYKHLGPNNEKYLELAKKPSESLTQEDKAFMAQHELEMAYFYCTTEKET